MLKEAPLLTVRRKFARPPADRVAKLKGAQTGHIVDAMMGRGALDYRIKPIDPANASFVGVALTCQPGADDNLAIMAALALAEPGDVIVAAADAFEGTAVVGDNVCLMARNKGLAGIVVDGMARDFDGIVAAGLPLHARGITPNSCMRTGPGKVGLPVVVAGQAVASGDIVLGDRDGVVIVPAAELEHVIAALDEIRAAEDATQAKIRAGMTHLESVAKILASDRVVYLD